MSEGSPRNLIPQHIEPRKFIAQSVDLNGEMAIEKLTRLKEAHVDVHGMHVELSFIYDEERRRTVVGFIAAELSIICQRCLKPMPFETRIEINWAIVWDEDQAKQLPGRLDPWIAGEEAEDLYAMIEEEVLLALPTAPLHETLCIERSLLTSGEAPVETRDELKSNPFQALAALKGKTKH